jgi:hypothetical protein
VDGECTNDEFDDHCLRWFNSEDAAVAEIATFGWGLYSDSLLPYRPKGHYTVSEEDRQTAERAILFLRTGFEYEWPRNIKGVLPYWCLWGPGWYLMIGMSLLFVAFANGGWQGLFLGSVGLLAVIPTLHWLFTHRSRVMALRRFRETGDVDVWPFLRQAEMPLATTR